MFVTDCQSLANIVNGLVVYTGKNEESIKELKAITRCLVLFAEKGWSTGGIKHDYTSWRERSFNKVADHYANVCMEEGRSWRKELNIARNHDTPYSMMIFSDGGKRDENNISAAWAIFKVRRGRQKEIANGAQKMEKGDSFTAEIQALRQAMEHTCDILGLNIITTQLSIWPRANIAWSYCSQNLPPR